MSRKRAKISVSVTDLPLNIKLEDILITAKLGKADGVEILPGIKVLPSIPYLLNLTQKYSLPILTIHHPISFYKSLIKSEHVFKIANYFKSKVIIHPLRSGLQGVHQKKYMKGIAALGKKFNVEVLVENIPNKSSLPIYKWISTADRSLNDLLLLKKFANTYKFGIAFDTAHYKKINLHNDQPFQKILPIVKNIHLSDFSLSHQHCYLGQGLLNSKDFFSFIKKNNYEEIITLEYTPRIFEKKEIYLIELRKGLALLKSSI